MQGTKGKTTDKNEDNGSTKKERHIVTWSQQEDDILREQIGIHGTDNWTLIASRFKDKTTRQCRRRWYTYLNSDFKKGGWTPEEDLLLCEAQKVFGNRWTEIAKVVSGRTDNAVKNRFTTLCKKRAKYEALAKDNRFPFVNSNNKRVMSSSRGIKGISHDIPAPKRTRMHGRVVVETCKLEDRRHVMKKTAVDENFRSPFAVLAQNIHKQNSTKQDINKVSENEDANKVRGTFLSKDDPKITALMQQAALLSSLALRVNEESTDQTLENAWKVLEDFLNQKKDEEINKDNIHNFDFQEDDFKDLLKELRNIDEENQRQIYALANFGQRQPELCDESSVGSECSTGSSGYQLPINNEDTGSSGYQLPINDEDDNEQLLSEADYFQSCEELTTEAGVVSVSSNVELGSPLQVTPLFRSLAAGIPSPKFSESERNFIMKTLGMESPSPMPNINPSHNPSCKRALLQHL
ncbi:hypothetical protein MLD38_004301 [Melastoma candidum]|uniref:Uncharacterized protein n=1 Tax=Melastoma candidum TaxID=119954 RepID=A0ACB9S5A5_9MYRT|nr:hypothetical protein MLD38_004301 [Melastoma candidum]